jgi:integrase
MSKHVVVDDLRFNPESGRYRREDNADFDLVHDAERDLWISDAGAEYVQNLNRIADPVYLRVDGEVWRSRYLGTPISINWSSINLPWELKSELRNVLATRLRDRSPAEIQKMRSLCANLISIWSRFTDHDFLISALQTSELTRLLLVLRQTSVDSAAYLRWLYRDMMNSGIPGCTAEKLDQLEQLRLNERKFLSSVRTWDPETGALTTAELEILRRNLLPPPHEETDTEHFARVMLRTLTALGRRPNQLLGVLARGIARPKHDARLPAVIWVPGSKEQRNDPPRPYDLPDDLFNDLMCFAQRPKVSEAQTFFGYFFVTPITSQTRMQGPRAVGNCNERLRDWIAKTGIISPRTGKPLQVTPTRLRHTAATQLVRKGWAKEDIQEFLEHRSETAVLAYLDAVGNDMTPALERSDRALGGLFSDLTKTFQGKVVPRPAGKVEKPIVVPSPDNKAVIGQCGLAGTCPKSPFSACLAGCGHFLFFKDADVAAARAYIHGEHARWRAAEGNAQRARAHDDFARMDAGLLEAQKAAGVTDEHE